MEAVDKADTRIYLLDDTYISLPITNKTTILELYDSVLNYYNIPNIPNLWLYECNMSTMFLKSLTPDEKIVNILDVKKKVSSFALTAGNISTFTEYNINIPCSKDPDDEYTFSRLVLCFRVIPNIEIPSKFEMFDYLVFLQFRFHILYSHYCCTSYDASYLAAILLKTQTTAFAFSSASSKLNTLIPLKLLDCKEVGEWTDSIHGIWEVLQVKGNAAMYKYLEYLSHSKTRIMDQFEIKCVETSMTFLPKECVLAIGCEGLIFLDPKDKDEFSCYPSFLCLIPFASLSKWKELGPSIFSNKPKFTITVNVENQTTSQNQSCIEMIFKSLQTTQILETLTHCGMTNVSTVEFNMKHKDIKLFKIDTSKIVKFVPKTKNSVSLSTLQKIEEDLKSPSTKTKKSSSKSSTHKSLKTIKEVQFEESKSKDSKLNSFDNSITTDKKKLPKDSSRHDAAALKIQAFYRGYRIRKWLIELFNL